MTRVLATSAAGLAVLGVLASVGYFLKPPSNEGFLRFPNVMLLHVIPGAVYLALAPFQFMPAIRRRALGYHRVTGRLLVGIGLVTGATAIFISLVIPFAGWSERIIVGGFGVFFVVALTMGFQRVRAGRIDQHREWMIRAFAIGLAIATMRALFIPLLVILGTGDVEVIRLLVISTFTAGFLINSSIAEFWIRHTRGQPIPASNQTRLVAV